MIPNIVYRDMWGHLTGRSRLLQDFREKNQKYDGWANQADLILDASITREYFVQFLQYMGEEDIYTELIRPVATVIVPPAVDDFSELPSDKKPDFPSQILRFNPLANSSRDTGQATLFQKSTTIELEQGLNAEQTGTLPPNVDLFRAWREIVRPTATKLIFVFQNHSTDLARGKPLDYLVSVLERHLLLSRKRTNGKTFVQDLVESEIDQETEYSLLSQLLDTNEQYFQQILEVLLASEVIELSFKLCCQNALSEIQCQVLSKLNYQPQTALWELVRLYLSGELTQDGYNRIMKFLTQRTNKLLEKKRGKYYLPNEVDSSDRESLLHEILVRKQAEFSQPKTIRKAIQSVYNEFLLKDIFQEVQGEWRKQTADIRSVNNVSLLVRQPNFTAATGGESNEDADQWGHIDKFWSAEDDPSLMEARTTFDKKLPILTEKFGEDAVRFMSIRVNRNCQKIQYEKMASLMGCKKERVAYIASKIRKKRAEIEQILEIELS